MGLNVFTLGNLVLCWTVMLTQLILSFATESSANKSGLVKASYEIFADFDTDIFAAAFTRNIFLLSKKEIPRTVQSLVSLDEATHKGLTFPRAVHLFFDKPFHVLDNSFHVLR